MISAENKMNAKYAQNNQFAHYLPRKVERNLRYVLYVNKHITAISKTLL